MLDADCLAHWRELLRQIKCPPAEELTLATREIALVKAGALTEACGAIYGLRRAALRAGDRDTARQCRDCWVRWASAIAYWIGAWENAALPQGIWILVKEESSL